MPISNETKRKRARSHMNENIRMQSNRSRWSKNSTNKKIGGSMTATIYGAASGCVAYVAAFSMQIGGGAREGRGGWLTQQQCDWRMDGRHHCVVRPGAIVEGRMKDRALTKPCWSPFTTNAGLRLLAVEEWRNWRRPSLQNKSTRIYVS